MKTKSLTGNIRDASEVRDPFDDRPHPQEQPFVPGQADDGNPIAHSAKAGQIHKNNLALTTLKRRLAAFPTMEPSEKVVTLKKETEAEITRLTAENQNLRAQLATATEKRGHFARLLKLGTHIAPREAILAGHEKELVTPEETKALRAIQAGCDKLAAELEKYRADAPRKAIAAARAAYAAAPTADNLAALHALETDSEEARREKLRLKRKPIAAALAELADSAKPHLRAIYLRAATFCEAESDRLAEAEKKLAARYGVPHEYGPLHGALARCAQNLLHPHFTINNLGPRENLRGILKL